MAKFLGRQAGLALLVLANAVRVHSIASGCKGGLESFIFVERIVRAIKKLLVLLGGAEVRLASTASDGAANAYRLHA